MAEENDAPKAAKHGNILTRKYGPLPGWGWGVVGVAGIVFFLINRKQRASAKASAQGVTSASVPYGGSSGGGSQQAGLGANGYSGSLSDQIGTLTQDISALKDLNTVLGLTTPPPTGTTTPPTGGGPLPPVSNPPPTNTPPPTSTPPPFDFGSIGPFAQQIQNTFFPGRPVDAAGLAYWNGIFTQDMNARIAAGESAQQAQQNAFTQVGGYIQNAMAAQSTAPSNNTGGNPAPVQPNTATPIAAAA